jgi:hypothetical protein
MKKTLVVAALACMLVAVAACGGSTTTAAPTATVVPTATAAPTATIVPSVTVVPTANGGSSSNGGSAATSADRAKFVGTWTGHYGCDVKNTVADKMVIKAGSGALDLSVTIHANGLNPDTVTGTLTSPTEVNVPAQSMGGMSGTAKLKLNGATLDFRETAMSMTCGGADYTRAP